MSIIYSKKDQDLHNNPEQTTDKVILAVMSDLNRRSIVGIKKYNTTLSDANLSHLDYLHHAYEEALDMANYLKGAIIKLNENKHNS